MNILFLGNVLHMYVLAHRLSNDSGMVQRRVTGRERVGSRLITWEQA